MSNQNTQNQINHALQAQQAQLQQAQTYNQLVGPNHTHTVTGIAATTNGYGISGGTAMWPVYQHGTVMGGPNGYWIFQQQPYPSLGMGMGAGVAGGYPGKAFGPIDLLTQFITNIEDGATEYFPYDTYGSRLKDKRGFKNIVKLMDVCSFCMSNHYPIQPFVEYIGQLGIKIDEE